MELSGVYKITYSPTSDRRGAFYKYFDAAEFRDGGLCHDFSQAAVATNRLRGTIRGLHFQNAPFEEAKLVRCIRGRIYDVVVDVRPGSKTRGIWRSFELSAERIEALYVPAGFAHGYQTLENDSDVEYLISEKHVPELQTGMHWNSPKLGISWPLEVAVLSERDSALPAFE